MTRTTHCARTGALPAIAAALALSSTPLFGQVAQPTEPTPATTTTTQPPVDAPPPTTSQAPPVTSDSSASIPTSTSTAARTSSTHSRSTSRTVHATVARPTATPARSVATRTTTTTRIAAPAAPAPVANLSQIHTILPNSNFGQIEASSGFLQVYTDLSSLAGSLSGRRRRCKEAASDARHWFAISRRRRADEAWHEDWTDEPMTEHETAAAAPAAVESSHDVVAGDAQSETATPSAFAWGAAAPVQQRAERDSDDDRLPGETWVQRAYRGPSANNPSVSLKNRLRRAAFFDKRERDVAAGIAEPVDSGAGLPGAMAEEQERELA